MDIFAILSLIGGLALFLYGMDVMGDGLKQLSGGKLEKILEKLTSNRFIAVLLGLGVTAIIQSSSATTVMVVGFVNSGIMKLTQAVGVIMGANIGTTVTSWLLSLTAIDGSSVWVKMLKPSSFSPILAVIGVIMIMTAKDRNHRKDIGSILIGFAVLMTGMEMMSSSVSPLADNEKFTSILTMFSNPLLGVLAGAILTAIIQSSSASVGILQALCATGAVNFATAVPIIMGQNIGTCVTALISSIGASKNARRASMIHLYFNLIGTILFMAVFYTLNAFFHFAFLSTAATAPGIAIIHSFFNIICTIVMFPFGNLLVKLAQLTIRDKKENVMVVEGEIKPIDERFLNTPGVAMEICRQAAAAMANETADALHTAMDALLDYSAEKAEKVRTLEGRVDRYVDVLGSYLIKLNSRVLSPEDSRTLSILLHCMSDFDRITDHAVMLCDNREEMRHKSQHFSDKAREELKVFSESIGDIMDETVQAFNGGSIADANKVVPLGVVIDGLTSELRSRHVRRLRKGTCSMDMALIMQEILYSMGRVADHCTNIAICLIQVSEDGLETHGYMEGLTEDENPWYEQELEEAQAKYRLPDRHSPSELAAAAVPSQGQA